MFDHTSFILWFVSRYITISMCFISDPLLWRETGDQVQQRNPIKDYFSLYVSIWWRFLEFMLQRCWITISNLLYCERDFFCHRWIIPNVSVLHHLQIGICVNAQWPGAQDGWTQSIRNSATASVAICKPQHHKVGHRYRFFHAFLPPNTKYQFANSKKWAFLRARLLCV